MDLIEGAGPRGLPLVGYIPFLSRYDAAFPYKALKKLGEVYGPVVGFYLGPSTPCVSVTGYDAVKEALRNPELDGRIITPAILQRSFGKSYGPNLDFHFFISFHYLSESPFLFLSIFIFYLHFPSADLPDKN